MRPFLIALSLALSCGAAAFADDTSQKLSAMEMTMFSKTYCKDAPIKRLQRLEENFPDSGAQKAKDLKTRIDEALARVNPTAEMLQRPDPCAPASAAAKKGKLFGLLTEQQPEGAWKERNYPYIEWQGRPIESVKEGIAQLKTDYPATANGYMKYVLTVKLPEFIYPRAYTITFLDEHGFKVTKFVVGGPQFEPAEATDGSKLWQAKDQAFIQEKDYKQARDYSVTANF